MKRIAVACLLIIIGMMSVTISLAEEDSWMIYAYIGDEVLEIQPERNSSAMALIDLLGQGDLTMNLHDYGGFEKVGPLGSSLPRNDEQITTEPGDVILYQGNQITIYYDVNSWSFTRLGKVQGKTQEELKAILGSGSVSVRFSLTAPAAEGRFATRMLEEGTRVNIWFGDILVPGTLNDSKASQALIAMLPYTVSVHRYTFDVCGMMNDSLPYDEVDEHFGWMNGDIDFATDGNWFTILFDNEENSDTYGYQVNLGKVDCDLSVLEALEGNYEVRIELAEE